MALRLGGKEARPLVQGGMGVGISAHRLAGSVAATGCVGTVSSVDLRRLHPDLMRETGRSRDRAAIEQANLTALEREVRAARELSGGRGAIAVNIMRAVSQYPGYVRTACASGADAIVVGAGLATDLPELAADWPHVALVPRWDRAEDMGHEDLATAFRCQGCSTDFTPAEAGRLRASEAERLRRIME